MKNSEKDILFPVIWPRKYISKEEALKLWPKLPDSSLDCTKKDCRCKVSKNDKTR